MNFLECTELINQWLTIILILGLSEEMYEDEYQNICLDLWELDLGENIWQIKYFNVPTQMTRHITVMVKTVSFKIGLSSCI